MSNHYVTTLAKDLTIYESEMFPSEDKGRMRVVGPPRIVLIQKVDRITYDASIIGDNITMRIALS